MFKSKMKRNFMMLVAVIILAIATACGSNGGSTGGSSGETNGEKPGSPEVTANPYPTKDIQMIVPFGAGGGTDRIARLVANALQEELGKPVVVVNKNAAAGVVGSNEIADSAKDGYTLGVFSNTDVANFVYAVKTGVNFQTDSFTYLGGLNETGDLLILPSNSDIDSLEDFIEKAKQNPGKLTVGLPSKTQELNVTLMENAAEIDLTGVVYESGNNVLADLIGGHVDAGILSAQFADQAEEQGLKVLGIMLAERLPSIPEIPTFLEQGYDVSNAAVRLLVGPADLPAEIVAAIEKALMSAYEGDLSVKLTEMGEVPKYRNMEELNSFLDQDFEMREDLLSK